MECKEKFIPPPKKIRQIKTKEIRLEGAIQEKVITRFAPEPSGYLHLGHVKALWLNDCSAKRYNGKMILRLDDTNPMKESVVYVDSIKKDLETLNIKPWKVTYTSMYFEQIQNLMEKMIQDGNAYCDQTTVEKLKTQRKEFIQSPYRENTIEENLRLWEEMKYGSEEGEKTFVRAKVDPDLWKNGSLRDPTLYRVLSSSRHFRTGTRFKAYPTYDFACPIVDSLEGVTHALRTTEYHDRNDQYNWILEKLHRKPIKIEDYSRLNFKYTLMSKRKLQWFVDHAIVKDWNSPAFPTVQGLLRAGLTIEALQEFIERQGGSKHVNLQDMDNLWALNKRIIDPMVPRYTAIVDEVDKPKVKMELYKKYPEEPMPSEVYYESHLLHKQNVSLGKKIIAYTSEIWIEQEDAAVLTKNEEVTLKDWGNCFIRAIYKEGDKVIKLKGELNLEGDYRKTQWKLTWLASVSHLVPVEMHAYDYLITKLCLEKEENFKDYLNPNIHYITHALGDPNLRLLMRGERFQLERRGYYICDREYREWTEKPLKLIYIPDGRKDTPSHLTNKLWEGRKKWIDK